MKGIIMTIFTATVLAVPANGQGYLNLDFESAQNLPGKPAIPDGVDVAATSALPGWTAYDGPNTYSEINYVSNYISGVATVVELEGGSLALSGNFSVGLYEGGSISQTGMLPDNAKSLLFEAQGPGPGYSLGGGNLSITLGGQTLGFSLLSQGPDYIVYGANIPPALDGQTEALIFGCQSTVGSGDVLLDNLEFSTSSIPEPGEWAFVGLWAAFFAVHRRRGQQR